MTNLEMACELLANISKSTKCTHIEFFPSSKDVCIWYKNNKKLEFVIIGGKTSLEIKMERYKKAMDIVKGSITAEERETCSTETVF